MLSGNFMYGGQSSGVDSKYASDRYVSKERARASNSSELLRTPTADHVYYNINITNSNPISLTPATFSETRTQAIVNNPSDYHMSVVRFKCPTNNIPLFSFQNAAVVVPGVTLTTGSFTIVIPNTTENLAIVGVGAQVLYAGFNSAQSFIQSFVVSPTTITLTFAFAVPVTSVTAITILNTPYTIFMIHGATSFIVDLLPPAPVTINGNLYTFIYSYQEFLTILNRALLVCYNALKVLDPTTLGTHSPFMTFDPTTNLFTLQADQAAWFPNVIAGNILSFSTVLRNLFDGLSTFGVPSQAVLNDPTSFYVMRIQNVGNNAFTVTLDPQGAGPYNTFAMVSAFSTLYSWSHFEGLVFLSGTIPVQSEFLGAQFAIGASSLDTLYSSNYNSQTQGGLGTSVFQPILTDFDAPKNPTFDKSPLQYIPQGEYRLVDLNGTTPLSRFDLQIYWKDRQNNLYPLLLSPYDYASIKILFRRKGALAAPPGSW